MKKLVLGVIALGVMVNVAFPIDVCFDKRRMYASCLKYLSGDSSHCGYVGECCRTNERSYTLEQLRMALEACEIQYGRYSN